MSLNQNFPRDVIILKKYCEFDIGIRFSLQWLMTFMLRLQKLTKIPEENINTFFKKKNQTLFNIEK